MSALGFLSVPALDKSVEYALSSKFSAPQQNLWVSFHQTRERRKHAMDLFQVAAAEAFIADDPYNQAGLFETVVIRPFHWGVGAVR
jgi:hypothetical protein